MYPVFAGGGARVCRRAVEIDSVIVDCWEGERVLRNARDGYGSVNVVIPVITKEGNIILVGSDSLLSGGNNVSCRNRVLLYDGILTDLASHMFKHEASDEQVNN